MPAIQIPRKIVPALVKPKRFKVIYGGRSSAKSTSCANIFTNKVQTEKADLLCLREFQSSIAQSVHKLLKKTIERSGAEGFRVLDNKIVTDAGNEIIFNGMARNSSAIKSAEDFKYSWVEEAQTCSQDSLDDLLPTIRKQGSELWFTANPQSSADPFSKRFIVPFKDRLDECGIYEDDLHLILKINWRDNPWHTEELESQRLYDYEHMSRAKYDWIWEGEFNDEVEQAIIPAEWFDAAIDAHVKLGFKARGQKILAHDPSDNGGDSKGIALRHGSVFLKIEENESKDVNDGMDWALDIAINEKVDVFSWDCDGMGISLKRQVNAALEGKKIEKVMYKGSESPNNSDSIYQPAENPLDEESTKTNCDVFKNKRAQSYWMLRDRFYNTYRAVIKKEYINPDDMISISSDIKNLQKIRAEVCRIPRKWNGNGMIQIMTKQEMKSLGIQSPNMADCMAMSVNTAELKKDDDFFKDIKVDNRWIV